MVVVAPELLVSIAFGDWQAARVGSNIFRKGKGDVNTWTKTHASFANMGGLVFQMRQEGREIPESAPFCYNGGVGTLGEIKDEVFHPTMKQLGIFASPVTQSSEKWIWGMVRWTGAPLWFLMRSMQTIRRAVYKKWKARTREPQRQEAHPETSELAQFPNSSSHSQTRTPPATSKVNRPARPEHTDLGAPLRSPSPQRLPSLDLGQPSHNLSMEEHLQLHPEPMMTSAVLENDERQISSEGDLGCAEDDQIREYIELVNPMIPDGQEISDSDETAHLLQLPRVQLHLNSIQIVVAQILGILGEVPQITSEDIEEKSKTNIFVKGIAALNLFWFSLKMIIQVSRQHTLSQLELASLTHVLYALFSYALFWYKPQGVERPIEHLVHISDTVRPVTEQDIRILRIFAGSPFLLRNFVPPFGGGYQGWEPTKPIPTDISLTAFGFFGPDGKQVFFGDSDFSGVVIGMVFGGLYCFGWHHPFPSVWEQWAWRISSLIITVSLVPYSIANAACTIIFENSDDPESNPKSLEKTHVIHILALYFLLGIYVFCRIFMLIEMVRTLFA